MDKDQIQPKMVEKTTKPASEDTKAEADRSTRSLRQLRALRALRALRMWR
jgi:hypothetical protein